MIGCIINIVITNNIMSKFQPLIPFYFPENESNNNVCEIGADEVGRGPLFGRVYSAAVILPRDSPDFKFEWMKDSKRFSSKKKIAEVAEYIKENAVSYGIGYEDESVIDRDNILQATQSAMRKAINDVKSKMKNINTNSKYFILVDGNYFKSILHIDHTTGKAVRDDYACIVGGDNKYCAIAAASILAKVSRDDYIRELCDIDPSLIERYDLASNKGYGTTKHIDGIRKFGYTTMHRKSFKLKSL
jgi:ribonuclease HII